MHPLAALRAEPPPRSIPIAGFHVMTHPVTQDEYHRYVLATGAREPWIDRTRWDAQQTGYAYGVAERFMWADGSPTPSRRHHPVVLVDHADASAYCTWWGEAHGGRGELPNEAQWNRAASGDDGSTFPWGNDFDPQLANTWESGLADTTPVETELGAASVFGVHDMAGNVFEWTRTLDRRGDAVVKGGSWNASLVDARTTARHLRPMNLRHVSVGFRCVFSAD